ncbi:anhydro-N-acetylmuramic acid kinase [Vulcaniibacterium thermophilum]|uniref:Anhydro-N-acetylmuramic acid kinase n=1 Tax=Vulcaniibacterium thermophilum TaxID=1169913 RepID=A0A918ZCM3_9GAMM|nr:anhydro-N-acetylmuramic acid kinase [Vulcaniibacterium thermophilum]GHE44564.1 anhydro-N-acetylmuramic acid kinase [Vulcaniibacterium thermophilum]
MAAEGLYLGLMSGTSADGIDAALVAFAADGACRLLAGRTFPWDAATRAQLLALGQGGHVDSLDEIGTLDVAIGEAFAQAALRLLAQAGVAREAVRAIGSHGQTIRHRPHGAAHDGRHPFTWQLGDAHVIAERTGIATVADFRRRDVAAGGHGAPLVPAFHAALLHDAGEDRAVLNLGGIANFTLLPAHGEVRGFDTGPANALLDAWCVRHLGHPYDKDGAFAAEGLVDAALLVRLLDDPWFAKAPPKSTGREHFHLDWLEARLRGDERPQDVQATLLELTAVSVADALRRTQPQTRRVIACGGGVRNPQLMRRLAAHLDGIALDSSAPYGLDPDFVEAMAFAWLARQCLLGRPGNLASVTGAAGPRVLGVVHPA